jgi:hypothetical protein
MNIARFVALDMHGARGSSVRRRLVLAEMLLAAAIGLGVAAIILTSRPEPTAMLLFGAALGGIGVNYAVLSAHAIRLIRPGALERELRGVDAAAAELRSYAGRQALLAVPFAVAALAVSRAARKHRA